MMMTTPHGLQVGQVVELNDGRVGIIRFVGETAFAGGEWVGVEFEDASGKNDGSVQGARYFDCSPGHGMFLRPTGVGRVLEDPTPRATITKPVVKRTAAAGTASPAKSRPTSVASRTAVRPGSTDTTTSRRQTINSASPTPAPRAVPGVNGAKVPGRITSKPVSVSSTTSSRGATPSANGRLSTTRPTPSRTTAIGTDGRRVSTMGTTPARTTRTALASSVTAAAKRSPATTTATTARKAEPRISLAARAAMPRVQPTVNGTKQPPKDSSPESVASSIRQAPSNISIEPGADEHDALSQTSHSQDESDADDTGMNGHAKAPAPAPATTQSRPPPRAATSTRQIEDLETRLKMMEKQRHEDKEKLKALERLQAERDRFEGIIQKLQTKYQPQQQELSDLRKQVQESEKKLATFESSAGEHESILEMAALDREMAEETAEGLRVELEALKSKAEELELELEVLREENEELGREMNPEEKTSQGWIHLERSNERLKEALIRLRDMTQEKEAELKDEIASLAEDLKDFDKIKEQYEEAQTKLQQSEAAVEDLRQQLDAALGSDDIVEELTEKNLALNEQIEEFRLTIEDLENLKEVNDELELNHIEAEKQMQDELDYKDSVIGEQLRRSAQQDGKLEDYEMTITRFRELVTNLQTDLEDMRASQQITEAEAEGLGQRSKAMLDLNMKLQNSVAKTQVKAVDLELRRLEAQEAIEHLAIVQLFLPESYQAERDSVMSLLRFKRIAYKSKLLHDFLKNQVSSVTSHLQDEAFTICDIMNKLTWIAAMCDRFVSNIKSCSLAEFARYEGALYDLDPVERGVNGYIEAWKRGELKERQVNEELQRSISLLTHLASVHIHDSLQAYADDVVMRTVLMQNQLENTALALTLTKTFIESSVIALEDDEEESELTEFSHQADELIARARSANVVIGKTHTSIEELRTRSMTLVPDTKAYFDASEGAVSDLASLVQRIGEHLQVLLQEESAGSLNALGPGLILSLLGRTTTEILPNAHDSTPFPTLNRKSRTVSEHLQQLINLSNDLSKATEFEPSPAPWVLRSQELKARKVAAVDTEAALARAKDELQQRTATLRDRDNQLREQALKMEMLESRMSGVNEKVARIKQLENDLSNSQKQVKQVGETLQGQETEIERLRADCERWRSTAEEVGARLGTQSVGDTVNGAAGQLSASAGNLDHTTADPGSDMQHAPAAREVEDLRREIRGLRSAVHYLRAESSRRRLAPPSTSTAGNATSASEVTPAPTDDLFLSPNAWLAQPLRAADRRAPLGSTQRKAQDEREVVLQAGKAAYAALRDLVGSARLVDLARGLGVTDEVEGGSGAGTVKSKLAWRPAREKSGWVVARQWEQWDQWAGGVRGQVVEKGRECIGWR